MSFQTFGRVLEPKITETMLTNNRLNRRLSSLLLKTTMDSIEFEEARKTTPDEDEEPKTMCDRIFALGKLFYSVAHVQKLIPLVVLIGYTFLGGAVIYYIEAPVEQRSMEAKQKFLDEQKHSLIAELWQVKQKNLGQEDAIMRLKQSVFWYTVTLIYLNKDLVKVEMNTGEIMNRIDTLHKYIDQTAGRCWEIQLEIKNITQVKRKIDDALTSFAEITGVSSELHYTWTFNNALFLAITIYTTIGYGSVAPETTAGKVATIIYAICGIPLYLLILHKFGRLFLAVLHKFYACCLWIFHKCRCIAEPHKYHETAKISFQGRTGPESYNVPVSLAIGVTFGWMFACAGVFCSFFETSWDYFTSFYFFFISLTTIGFGDVTPTHTEDMFAIFGFIMIGLSLVSMCINVVQLKLEQLFEEMMLTLMEEYRDAQLMDAQLGVPPDANPSLGLSTLFNLWKKKRNSDASSNFYVSLMARRQQQALMDEWTKRAKMKVVGTQTDLDNYCNISTQTELYIPNPQILTLTKSPFSRQESTVSYAMHMRNPQFESYPFQLQKALVRSPSMPLPPPKVPRASFITSVSAEIHAVDDSYIHSPSDVDFEMMPESHTAPLISGRRKASSSTTSSVPLSLARMSEAPAMYVPREYKPTDVSDFKGLLHEIGARLTECRNIVTGTGVPTTLPKPTVLQLKLLQDNEEASSSKDSTF